MSCGDGTRLSGDDGGGVAGTDEADANGERDGGVKSQVFSSTSRGEDPASAFTGLLGDFDAGVQAAPSVDS